MFYKHSADALKILLEKNADPNKMDICGNVPLAIQLMVKNSATLLNHSAKVKINNQPFKLRFLDSIENRKVLEDYAHSLEEETFKIKLNAIKDIAISEEQMGLLDALNIYIYIYDNTNDYIKGWRKDNSEFSAINQTDIVYNKIIKKQEHETDTTHKEYYSKMTPE